MGSGFSKMKKQARLLQQQYSQMQEELKALIVTGSAGNGLVTITMNGEKQPLKVSINPQCVDKNDVEGLEDLLLAAYNDALKKVAENSPENELSSPFGF